MFGWLLCETLILRVDFYKHPVKGTVSMRATANHNRSCNEQPKLMAMNYARLPNARHATSSQFCGDAVSHHARAKFLVRWHRIRPCAQSAM